MLNKRWRVVVGLVFWVLSLTPPGPALAQDTREVELIAELGVEMIAEREAAKAAAIEAEHRRILEEQSELKQMYRDYLGEARRTAQALIDARRRQAAPEQVDRLRAQALAVVATVDDATKQRVRDELDKHFDQLERGISVSPEQLLGASPKLATAYKRLGDQDLGWVNRTAILYALCPTPDEAKVIAGNVKFRERLTADEAASIDETNRRRLILGLEPLAVDIKLVEAGRDHSKDMVERGFFSHDSPVPGKEKFTDRAKNFGTTAGGENIAAGYSDGRAVTVGWWYSPGHLKNMMAKGWKRIGVGQHQQHYTQMFGR